MKYIYCYSCDIFFIPKYRTPSLTLKLTKKVMCGDGVSIKIWYIYILLL